MLSCSPLSHPPLTCLSLPFLSLLRCLLSPTHTHISPPTHPPSIHPSCLFSFLTCCPCSVGPVSLSPSLLCSCLCHSLGDPPPHSSSQAKSGKHTQDNDVYRDYECDCDCDYADFSALSSRFSVRHLLFSRKRHSALLSTSMACRRSKFQSSASSIKDPQVEGDKTDCNLRDPLLTVTQIA